MVYRPNRKAVRKRMLKKKIREKIEQLQRRLALLDGREPAKI